MTPSPIAFCFTVQRLSATNSAVKYRGKQLTITATGTISKDIEQGAKVLLQVKYGLIRLISQEVDLCNEITKVDMDCPIEKGHITLSKDVQLPREIPPVRNSMPLCDEETISYSCTVY